MAESADALDSGSSGHYKLVWVQVPPPAPVTLGDALNSLDRNRLSLARLLEELWARIGAVEPDIHAFLSLADPTTLVRNGRSLAGRPLRGIPVAVKDNICTTEFPTTCGSRLLRSFRSPFDATCVARLRAAGAQVQGKTNLDEFAMGSSTEHSAEGPTRNPHAVDYIPGGSSGGSAAAVAAGEALAALGSDTSGSVRQPAALCGVVGLRPTYGLVSRWGLVSLASSLDTVGILTSCVEDAARLLGVIAGADRRDPTSLATDIPDYGRELVSDLKGLRLGVPTEFAASLIEEDACCLMGKWQELAEDLGALIVELHLPALHYALPAYHLLASAEASSNLARYDGVRYTHRADEPGTLANIVASRTQGFGWEVKRRIALGAFALSAGRAREYYGKAQEARGVIADEMRRAFQKVDFVLTPTSPTTAFPLGARCADPIAMYHSDVFTAPASLAGLPAVSIPGGDLNGLPFGIQLVGPKLNETRLLSAAYALESAVRSEL